MLKSYLFKINKLVKKIFVFNQITDPFFKFK